jgi:capsular polysaccharide biosynthesis protein
VHVDSATHRSDVPPSIDLAGHMRELGRALLPAIVVALLVGAAVFYVRSELTDKQYSASVVTEIKPSQTLVPGDAFVEQMRAPFVQLAADTDVLNQVLGQVDADLDAATLGGMVTTTPGTSPALLTFEVEADSPELAQELVQSVVATVAQASQANYARDTQDQVEQAQASIAAEQARVSALPADSAERAAAEAELNELQTQLSSLQGGGGDQLVVLSSPEQSTTPVSPKPVSEALVAALAALIVAAELIVLLRGRFGSKPSRSWARRAAKKNGARFDTGLADTLPPILVARIDTLQRDTVETSTNARHSARKRDAVVVILVGDDAAYVPPPTYSPSTVPQRSAVITMGLTDEWWRAVDIADVDTIVVLLSKGGHDRKDAERTLRRIAEFDRSAYLLLQSKSHNRPAPQPTTAQNAEVDSNAG